MLFEDGNRIDDTLQKNISKSGWTAKLGFQSAKDENGLFEAYQPIGAMDRSTFEGICNK